MPKRHPLLEWRLRYSQALALSVLERTSDGLPSLRPGFSLGLAGFKGYMSLPTERTDFNIVIGRRNRKEHRYDEPNREQENSDYYGRKPRHGPHHRRQPRKTWRRRYLYLSFEPSRGRVPHSRNRGHGRKGGSASTRHGHPGCVRRVRGGCPQNARRLGTRTVRLPR